MTHLGGSLSSRSVGARVRDRMATWTKVTLSTAWTVALHVTHLLRLLMTGIIALPYDDSYDNNIFVLCYFPGSSYLRWCGFDENIEETVVSYPRQKQQSAEPPSDQRLWDWDSYSFTYVHSTYLLAEKKRNNNENEKDNSAIEMRTESPSRKGIDGTPTIMMG